MKTFIIIMGGVAVGKSHVYRKFFGHMPLIDIDEYTYRFANGDWELARKMISKSIRAVEEDLIKTFKTGESVVNTCTGASPAGITKKINAAKAHGYHVHLVHVKCSTEKALRQNKQRADAGARNLVPDYKIIRTIAAADKTFQELQKEVHSSLIVQH